MENASWCLGCAQYMLLMRAIMLVGRRNGMAPLVGEYALLGEFKNYAAW